VQWVILSEKVTAPGSIFVSFIAVIKSKFTRQFLQYRMSSTRNADEVAEEFIDFDNIDFGPDAYGVLMNMDFGGMNLPEIVEELKDNCDDAGASRTDIFLVPSPDTKCLTQINVLDDGCGMTPRQLFNACRIAGQSVHKSGDIGKFGMGMKNATMAAGRFITIFTKTESTGAIAIILDTDKMKMDRTFRPTHFTDKAIELSWSLPKDIWRRFSAMPSGTLINVRNLKDTYIRNAAETAKELQRALNLAYISATKNSAYIHVGTLPGKTSLTINPVDTFYRNRPDALKYCSETTLRVYKATGEIGIRVLEVLEGQRVLGINKTDNTIQWGRGDGEESPQCYRIWLDRIRTNSGKDKIEYRHDLLDEIPNDDYVAVKVRFISLTIQAFKEEGLKGYFSELDAHRRGIYMYRDNRLVAPCLTLGEPMDDKCNRQRMEVIFPPSLDFEMGVRTQKQLTNHLNSQVISDALRVLWHQQNSVCVRAKDMNGTVDAVTEEVEEVLVNVPVAVPPQRKGKMSVRAASTPEELYSNELILETPEQTAAIANAAAAVIASAAPEIVATTPMFTQRVYAEFAKEMRERLLKTNPTWTSHEVIREIGRLWGIHTQTPDYTSVPEPVAAPAPPPVSRYANTEIPLPTPLYYSATNHPLSPQAFTAAKTEEVLNEKLMETVAQQGFAEPPPSNARSYTKYSDEIRPWIIQTYPRWSVDQIISETTRLWKMQQDKIKAIKQEVAPPPPQVSRAPPSFDRRSTAPPPQSAPTVIRGPRSTDPVIAVNTTASATTATTSSTTRGARAAAASEALARTPRMPPVPPGPLPIRGPSANGAAQEIDWTKVLTALPKSLPSNKNEKHVLDAIMGVWKAGEGQKN